MRADHLGRLPGVSDLGTRLGNLEQRLEHALYSPTALASPSRRITDAGGKRLRRARTIACARLGGIDEESRSRGLVQLLQTMRRVDDSGAPVNQINACLRGYLNCRPGQAVPFSESSDDASSTAAPVGAGPR